MVSNPEKVNSFEKRDAWMRGVLADPALKATAKNVAVRLALHLNVATRQCNPSYATLAKEVGLKWRRTVMTAMGELAARDWIVAEKGSRSNNYVLITMDRVHGDQEITMPAGDGETTITAPARDGDPRITAPDRDGDPTTTTTPICDGDLEIIMPSEDGDPMITTPAGDSDREITTSIDDGDQENTKVVVQGSPGWCSTDHPINEMKSEVKREGEKHSPDLFTIEGDRGSETKPQPVKVPKRKIDWGFSRFWNNYPKRIAKADARREFESAVGRGVPIEQIVEGARRYATECYGREPRFIPYPRKWLQGSRWDDEPAQEHRNGAPLIDPHGNPISERPARRKGGYSSLVSRYE